MQPLRVRSGGLNLNLPVSYGCETHGVGYDRQMFNLTPSGREIDLEAAYGLSVLRGAGQFSANAFLRHQCM